ncbi:keratin-associated protein 13-1-like isoform X1 [Grammomys surdaster]|uniref:keratin-associated protein 13-1-like isoform X1 n=1 Tax=Grammomys surdaster TaxID=491861 RepID=UPI00109F2A06|nr:keratin-associated protein 13-1-like isoform X1 [Grammomys surdaster]
MAYNCCSGNFSSRSLRSCLPSSGYCRGSSYPSNLVYTSTSCSPSTCQLSSTLHSGCQETFIEPTSCSPSICQLNSSLNNGFQETCIEPISCQRSCVVSSHCQKPCYYPRSSTPCSPCQGTYAGSLGFGSSSCSSLGYGSRSCYSVGCGNRGFRSLNCGVYGFPSLRYGSKFYYPVYAASTRFQPSCYRSICGTGF